MSMSRIADVIALIEDFAPSSLQETWDNSGLCIGDASWGVNSVILALDCTEAVVDEAIATGANLIITHHPLIFSGLKNIHPTDPVGSAVIKAIKNDIAIYATHTPSDKVMAGVSGAMARKMGMENLEFLDESGLGVIGDLPTEMNAEEFVQFVKNVFSLKSLRCSKPISTKIKKVAMCGGSGSSFISKAHALGAQAYLCGDISYHNFFCKKDFMIMDIGHYESEIEIVEILFSLIKKNFSTFAVRIATNNNNPIYYF